MKIERFGNKRSRKLMHAQYPTLSRFLGVVASACMTYVVSRWARVPVTEVTVHAHSRGRDPGFPDGAHRSGRRGDRLSPEDALGLRRLFCVALATAAILAPPKPAFAQQTCARPVARFESVTNSVQLVQASTRTSMRAAGQVAVCARDTIQVGDNSRAIILILASNTPLRLDQNSEFVITDSPDTTVSFLELLTGALFFITRTRRSFEIRTPFVTAAVEGTELVVRVQTDRTVITVLEGAVRATNPLGTVVVGPGQQAVAIQGQAPQLQINIRPRDAVQWALYYQPIMPLESLDQLNQVAEANRGADFFIRRASALLGVQRLEDARADIDESLRRDSNLGDAHALRAVIAVALNDPDQSLTSAREAVARSPQSAAAHIALSYALQSRFDLAGARGALLRAVELKRDDGLAWARLAEIELSLGDRARALDAARRAVSLSPAIARASTVLGFAALAAIDRAAADATFEQAIGLESDSPLARLGLGLAKIRAGDLEEGRRQLEIAAVLNPDDPIIRSYLGKAYFEEKRDALAADQFAMAKALDPLDPTPWFYDAIRKQTLNRPVEALRDLQRSIELNDNRAIYRSRMLLDEDLAARSASLSRIYGDLGFENVALVEGWKSVNVDPANYSAHRLLADTYAALPRHNVARVSELLQSQLRQPISSTPLQPELAESDLFIQDGAGSSQVAFNEFAPLFTSDGFAVQTNGVVGNHGSLGDDLVFAGILGKMSFSVGQFHFHTNGSRANNDQDQNIYNAFFQATVSPRTSLQAEYRTRDFRRGDLLLRFDTENFFLTKRQVDDVESLRFGVRQELSRNSDVIANVSFQRADIQTLFPPVVNFVTGEQAYIAEVQHFYRTPRFSVTSGIGHVVKDGEMSELPLLFPAPPSVSSTDVSHSNIYLYAQTNVVENVAVTVGASSDFFRGPEGNPNQFNPKGGVIWVPFPATTVRAAAFRTLRRTLLSNQTIEPTQVAGFNQLFDDVDASDAWRYGVAVDQKISTDAYAGGEYSRRDIHLTRFGSEPSRSAIEETFKERVARAYVHWAPGPMVALSTEYQYEPFDRSYPSEEDFTALTSHRVALGCSFFHPSGLRGGLTGTHVNQQGVFQQSALGSDVLSPDKDSFWIVDLSAGYRLPKRFGLITLLAKNVFDKRFKYQETDLVTPSFVPDRQILLRVSLFVKK
jgi:tetratricopeptide (TPR) repeat protein